MGLSEVLKSEEIVGDGSMAGSESSMGAMLDNSYVRAGHLLLRSLFDRGCDACTVLNRRKISIREELSRARRNPVGHTSAISI